MLDLVNWKMKECSAINLVTECSIYISAQSHKNCRIPLRVNESEVSDICLLHIGTTRASELTAIQLLSHFYRHAILDALASDSWSFGNW